MKEKTTNKTRPEVKIMLDKMRSFKLDLNAMVSFGEASGKNLVDGTFDGSNMSPRDLRAMAWACLLHEDYDLTEREVGSWITPDNMMEIATKLNEAFEVAMPEGEKKGAAPLVKKPSSSTG